MENFLEAIRKYVPVSREDASYFYSCFDQREYKKNGVLLSEGQVANEVFFVVKGALRQHFVTENGSEKDCYFVFENEFLTDLESFSRQTKATTNITALEPTECLVISCKDIMKCMSELPAIASLFNVIVENVATENIRRIQSLLSKSPEQRFEELLQARPEITRRIPQRYIAQYLGVAPESLSRIRKRILTSLRT